MKIEEELCMPIEKILTKKVIEKFKNNEIPFILNLETNKFHIAGNENLNGGKPINFPCVRYTRKILDKSEFFIIVSAYNIVLIPSIVIFNLDYKDLINYVKLKCEV